MNKDLTVGEPKEVLWRFCLPLFGSIIFQQLYNIADSFVAGRFISENALAAVGNSYEITLIFLAFAFGCNIGCSVITSRYFGGKDYKGMKTAVLTSIITSAAICATLMALGGLFSRQLLTLIDTPAEVFEDSLIYLKIYVLGLAFVFFYNLSTGIFSALGDSKTPFIFLVVSSVSNIVVDILFVKSLDMGVAGVAWATFICQGFSCICAVTVVYKRISGIETAGPYKKFSIECLKQFLVIAIPSTIQQSFISVGNIVIQRVINGFGPGVMAGYSAAIKLNNLVMTSFTTLGNGISNYTSQNLGTKKYDRIRAGLKAGLRLEGMLAIPISILYFLAGKYLLGLFLDNPTPLALESGLKFLRIAAPWYLVVVIKLSHDGVLRGAGLMKYFMMGTLADLFLRVVLAIVLAQTSLGYIGIWYAWPVGWLVGMAISVVNYHKWIKRV